MMNKKEMELYLHIPFCIKKCNYCDFLSGPAEESVREQYVEDLCKEIDFYGELGKEKKITSIFFGGGTPSLLSLPQWEKIFHALTGTFSLASEVEITTEANPGTVDAEKLRGLYHQGINRLSLGLQSAREEELRCLGRIHTWEEFLQGYEDGRKAGFSNINVDLMSALPGQTWEKFSYSLEKVLALHPEHLSVYSLIIEEGTPFYEKYKTGEGLPEEEEEREIYDNTKECLRKAGYESYEISNYAKKGYACKHNIGYWTGKEYLGLGVGAASFLKKERWENVLELQKYHEMAPFGSAWKKTPVSQKEREEEYYFLGLRMSEGVEIRYEKRYGALLLKLEHQGLIQRKNHRVCLTPRGIDISNYVFTEFLEVEE